MKDKNYTGLVPAQKQGTPIDAESSVTLGSREEALACYKKIKERLLDVNHWAEYAGWFSANFQRTDSTGKELHGPIQQGDRLKIDIPGPGSSTGDGFDWVEIEALEEISSPEVESLAFRVRPTEHPKPDRKDVAHFYSEGSTSTFTVTREGTQVTVGIYDRNVTPNTEAEHTPDKIRDAVIGAAGLLGFSKIQWKGLAEGLLKTEITEPPEQQ